MLAPRPTNTIKWGKPGNEAIPSLIPRLLQFFFVLQAIHYLHTTAVYHCLGIVQFIVTVMVSSPGFSSFFCAAGDEKLGDKAEYSHFSNSRYLLVALDSSPAFLLFLYTTASLVPRLIFPGFYRLQYKSLGR